MTGSPPRPTCAEASLLLDVGVPFRRRGGAIELEAQAHHGVQRWLDHFDRLTLCAPVAPEDHVDPSMQWLAAESIDSGGRFCAVPLPCADDARSQMRSIGTVRRTLRQLIPRHSYLCFSNLEWLGAWGRVAAEEAHRLGRPFAVWLDWVLQDMPLRSESSWLKRR